MSLLRAIVCVIFPPLGVYDKGCGNILLVGILTLIGWIPGVIAAMIVCNLNPTRKASQHAADASSDNDWRRG